MSMNKKKFLGAMESHSLSYNSFSFKMASRNRLLPVWVYTWCIHVMGYTRGGVYTWVGMGYFSLPRAKKKKKIKGF